MTLTRRQMGEPTHAGWFYGRHKLQRETFPIEPQRVLKFANGFGVPNGGGFVDVSAFDWYGPVPVPEVV